MGDGFDRAGVYFYVAVISLQNFILIKKNEENCYAIKLLFL